MPEGQDIVKWADAAMYEAQPILKGEGTRVTPRVFLLNATPDPLGTCAADMRMYRGDPVYSLEDITDEQRKWAWGELMKTHLNTPLEGVTVKFMIEAVTRSFTHQMVRQRVGAYYVQESLRFAVKRGLAKEVALPPSIHGGSGGEGPWHLWHKAVEDIERVYNQLVDAGIPAEDARGLLPHATTTRIIYTTNLRALFEHAGNRLCTQAQFEWRSVFMGIMQAMRAYPGNPYTASTPWDDRAAFTEEDEPNTMVKVTSIDDWQWELIAEPRPFSFTPICYRQGKCAFMSELDRGCTIRDRVQAFAESGVPSSEWEKGYMGGLYTDNIIPPIDPAEWMANPWAGITTEDNRPQ